jgi:hypothetical protein
MKPMVKYLILMMILTGCTEFAMLSSIGGVAVSHSAYAKVYGGLDFLTIINTEKDIKTHLYESIRHDDE